MIKVEELRSGRFLDQATNILSSACQAWARAMSPPPSATHSSRRPLGALHADLRARAGTPRRQAHLQLPRALRKLDAFELAHPRRHRLRAADPGQIEVLFTLMAERYERRSLLITSNLVFSAWDESSRTR